jgi:predicted dehydrogenase
MNDRPVRVGIVGLGGICRNRHIPGLRAISGVEIVAVANRTPESGARVAAEFNIPRVCDSWEELVALDDVDAVLIGTWPYMHCPVSLAALSHGKHVFCQARLAMDHAEALRMRDAARASGRVAMVCPVPIGMAVDATVGRLLRDPGGPGTVRLVRVQSFSNAYADPGAFMNWRKDHRLSGLNMHTFGMFVEVMHRWFGWTRSVSASMQTYTPERVDADGEAVRVRIPDQFLVDMEMEAGFHVQCVFNAAVHHGEDTIDIFGSDGSMRYEVARDALSMALAGERVFSRVEPLPTERYDLLHWCVEHDFINAIRTGSPARPDFEDGRRYMEVVDAAWQSAAEGRRLTLA